MKLPKRGRLSRRCQITAPRFAAYARSLCRTHAAPCPLTLGIEVIRPTILADRDAILALVEASGQFDADGLAHVRSTLDSHLAGQVDGLWVTADDGEPVGVAYCAPEPVTSGTWNLLMLWTRDDRHGRGHGTALVRHVERALRAHHARLLIVETSALPAFADFLGSDGLERNCTGSLENMQQDVFALLARCDRCRCSIRGLSPLVDEPMEAAAD